MRRLFFLSILILFCSIGVAQTRAEKKFIRMVIGSEHILYNDKINFYWIKEIKGALNKDTLYDWKDGLRYEKRVLPDSLTFVLTASERSFIYQELDKMNTFVWKNNIFKHSILVTKQKAQQYKDLHGGQPYYESQEYKDFINLTHLLNPFL